MNYSIALTLVEGIGPSRAKKLCDFFGSAKEIFSASIQELHNHGNLPLSIAEKMSYSRLEERVDSILEWCERNGVTVIYARGEYYPPLLQTIYDPPTVLYGMGDLSLLRERSIAMVGMRKITDYGLRVTDYITDGLCQSGMTITSGLAYGVDAAAHESALRHHGKTIAVMATGPDRVYPAAHRDLAARIQNKGAIITEYPPGSEGHKYCFVQRNRIVSGMSEATIVVEAAHKSGSLITANFALSQGRELFAVPGSIFNRGSEGTNELIAAGATPALSAQQIVSHLFGEHGELPLPPEGEQLTLFENSVPDYLSEVEGEVLKLLSTEHPLRAEELVDVSGISIDQIFTILLSLEMNLLIQQVPGGGYRRV